MIESDLINSRESAVPDIKRVSRMISFGIWPGSAGLDIHSWMGNFKTERDKLLAHELLSGLLYFSPEITDRILLEACRSSVLPFIRDIQSKGGGITTWEELQSKSIFTWPQGENPGPTDSGYVFTRKCRDVLGIEPDRFKEPKDAIRLIQGGHIGPIIFVDDFCGSGDQIDKTLKRSTPISEGKVDNLMRLIKHHDIPTLYIVCVAHAKGMARLNADHPYIRIAAGNTIDDTYCVFNENGMIWSDQHKDVGPDWVREMSKKAGISENDAEGFRSLGLALGFQHGFPDATIPLFYHESPDWNALKVRR